ncbi:uncharacterized protein LOC128869683 [Anastrepha ludens]|uniref:uncharacterized protein LOC128869683 n=1 Tax=Anastrepha ludens TaxID=28586 RepID=UPI0023AFD5A9|nr:uncharacterized protein LOC128869683 [Anastrepha ludens]
MPCLCANKVERTQDKVQCDKCNDLFHLNCVNLQPVDLEFLLKSGKQFICDKCAAARRQSLRAPSTPINLDDEIATADNVPVNPANLSTQLSPHQQLPKSTSADDVNNLDISLNTIIREIAALRSENARAMAAISSLKVDKQLLISQISDLCAEVKELQKHQTVDVSSALVQLTAEVKDLNACVLACECHARNTKNAKSKSKRQESLSVTAATSPVNVPIVAAPHGETNSFSSASHSHAAAGDAPLSYSAAVTNTAKVKLTPIAAAAATTSVLPSTSTCRKASALPTSLAPTSNRTREWKTVTRANRKKLKQPLVIGSNQNSELSVVPNMKWLHISSFSNTVTAADIVDYVAKHAEIDRKFLSCYMLIKKDTLVKDFKKINFKLGVSEFSYDKLLNADIWPTNVKIRPFTFFQKDVTPPLIP